MIGAGSVNVTWIASEPLIDGEGGVNREGLVNVV